VEKRRRITEDDVLMTEAMIARSYKRLKQSVARAPSRAFSSAGETVRKHPLATAAAAVGVGITLYGLFRMMTRKGAGGKDTRSGERRSGPDIPREILSMIIPLAAPYVTMYLKNYMAKVFSGERD
jgi:hypothetical protein